MRRALLTYGQRAEEAAELVVAAEVTPGCRLYLQLPAQATPSLEAQLADAIAVADPACVLLCRDGQQIEEGHAARLVRSVHESGPACLVEDDATLALRLRADGVHLRADADAYARARDLLGKEMSIGVECGLDRHEAMRLAELGADYIAFTASDSSAIDAVDQLAELIAWWAEIFVVPCVAWNVDDPEDAAKLARLGADFVAPSPRIWRDEGAAALVSEIANAVGQARRAA